MWSDRFRTIGGWLGALLLLFGLYLVVREYLVTVAVTVGILVIALAAFSAWYDYDHWQRKYLVWRHADVLAAAEALFAPHVDDLAREMGGVLKWDGRHDYHWGPWVDVSRAFVEATIIPAMAPDHRRRIADHGKILSEEIRSRMTAPAFARAQQLGLLT